jgi:hypothetical protein
VIAALSEDKSSLACTSVSEVLQIAMQGQESRGPAIGQFVRILCWHSAPEGMCFATKSHTREDLRGIAN